MSVRIETQEPKVVPYSFQKLVRKTNPRKKLMQRGLCRMKIRLQIARSLILLMLWQPIQPAVEAASAGFINKTNLSARSATPRETKRRAGEISYPAVQSAAITLTPINTAFNDPVSIDYHEPTHKLIISCNSPAGQPRNFELVSEDATRTPFSAASGIAGRVLLAVARDEGGGLSHGGFRAGEAMAASEAGVIARISADGSSIQNPWVTLPTESGSITALHIDRTGIYGGDLTASTASGKIWRVKATGETQLVADAGAQINSVATIPKNDSKYGPWSGKIIAAGSNVCFAISPDGTITNHSIGISPQQIALAPSGENFYGIDSVGRTFWGAAASQTATLAGEIIAAEKTSGKL